VVDGVVEWWGGMINKVLMDLESLQGMRMGCLYGVRMGCSWIIITNLCIHGLETMGFDNVCTSVLVINV